MIQINAARPLFRQKAGMDTDFLARDASTQVPLCPHCGRPMRFVRAVPRLAALPELRTYACRACGVSYTEAVEDGDESAAAWIED